jgi:tetratricopeptide (TPR) repeat protein
MPGASPPTEDGADLPADRKREIIALEAKLTLANPFELLGVPVGSSAAECKSAYYALSMRLHPDRFYGKDLGSFRSRIERVFAKLTEAQLAVTDADRRANLERERPELFPRKAAAVNRVPSVVYDMVRSEDRAKRLAKHPYLARVMKKSELVFTARKALEVGNPTVAASQLKMLLAEDPNNAEAKRLLEEVNRELAKVRCATLLEESRSLLAIGDRRKALDRYAEVLSLQPSAELCETATDVAILEQDYKSARQFTATWVQLNPRNAKARRMYAVALSNSGMVKNALREAEEALRLDPTDKETKSLLNKLK